MLTTPLRVSLFAAVIALTANPVLAQLEYDNNIFKQLGTELPTPNTYRTASGAPGQSYWQQRADYSISVRLDDEKQAMTGEETITYHNRSPHTLTYLWLQLDQNLFSKESDSYKIETFAWEERISSRPFNIIDRMEFDGGYKIDAVTRMDGKALSHTIVKTMMRIDLPQPLKPGQQYAFNVRWHNNINDVSRNGGRSGYEFFPGDGNYLYEIAQFFPRMAVYDDVNGWQHKQFLGQGEFALPFGSYQVSIDVPADHIVAATGTLQNEGEVLSAQQRGRLQNARKAGSPVLIVNEPEARNSEKTKSSARKKWKFAATNVRDFAFASSRKFIWDAMNVTVEGKNVLAASFYPKEGNPLWGKYSTEVVAHTLKTYSKFSVGYPYPTAISVHGPVFGMEYPMICFNGGRPDADGTYGERIKFAMISVIIHEVGHNFFPMIINSDERQWTWLDEGLNTFLQYLTEQEWQRNYPSSRGEAASIVDYMKSEKSTLTPIMVNSESILQFGNNAYGKPACGLNILRETVMGRQLFDYAFKTYAQRWAFKHPQPADFFRTMEDASGIDLDWFWRGWFYTTNPVDIAITSAESFSIADSMPQAKAEPTVTMSNQRNSDQIKKTYLDAKPGLKDYYDSLPTRPFAENLTRQEASTYFNTLNERDKKLVARNLIATRIKFDNIGGLVMPVILRFSFSNNKDTVVRIPVEIWRQNNKSITKTFFFAQTPTQIELDPYFETADINMSNNSYPAQLRSSRFRLFKDNFQQKGSGGQNMMQFERKQLRP